MSESHKWGGPFNAFDEATGTAIKGMIFGTFEGTTPDAQLLGARVKQHVEEAVEACGATHAAERQDQIAAKLNELAAGDLQEMGAAGHLTIAGITIQSSEQIAKPQAAAAPQAAPAPAAGPTVGSAVLVTWSDGNRYPGSVIQIGNGQFLVRMSDGQQHWVLPHVLSLA